MYAWAGVDDGAALEGPCEMCEMITSCCWNSFLFFFLNVNEQTFLRYISKEM